MTNATQALPDLNAVGKYDWNSIQRTLDHAAWLNMFVVPTASGPNDNSGFANLTGATVELCLHRFKVELALPSLDGGIKTTNILGQQGGRLSLRWRVIPDDFPARPGLEPPATLLVPASSQRFAMQEATFAFGNGADGFSSFGTGRIFPEFGKNGVRLRAGAVGNIMEGFGKMKGLKGTYIFAGDITPKGDFAGTLLVRVIDPNDVLRATSPIEAFVPAAEPDPRTFVPDTTYIILRGQKEGPGQRTTYNLGSKGQMRGINVPQIFRQARVDFSAAGPRGLENEVAFGDSFGGELSMSAIDVTHPGPPGTADHPSVFQGTGTYVFRDQKGNDVGKFTVQFLEGRTFAMELGEAPGQPAARFGSFGPLLAGEGYFSGVSGMLLGTDGVTLMPHVFSAMQMLCLNDPGGKFRVK